MKCFYGLLYMGHIYGMYILHIILYGTKLWPNMTNKMIKMLSDHSSLSHYYYKDFYIYNIPMNKREKEKFNITILSHCHYNMYLKPYLES